MDAGVRRVEQGGPALRGHRQRDRASPAVHAGVWHRPRGQPPAPRGRLLHEPRSPDPRVRGGAHPAGLPHRRLVRLLGPHALDRRPDAPDRRCAPGVPPRGRQPRRLQDRARRRQRDGARSVRAAQPGPGARPADPDQPDGGRQGRGPAPAAARRGARQRAPGGLGVRPHARQHLHLGHRPQDPPLRLHPRRDRRLRAGPPSRGDLAGRRPRGADRRRRHRVPRRRRGGARRAPRQPLRDHVRPTAQRPPVARPRLPPGRAHAAPASSGPAGPPGRARKYLVPHLARANATLHCLPPGGEPRGRSTTHATSPRRPADHRRGLHHGFARCWGAGCSRREEPAEPHPPRPVDRAGRREPAARPRAGRGDRAPVRAVTRRRAGRGCAEPPVRSPTRLPSRPSWRG